LVACAFFIFNVGKDWNFVLSLYTQNLLSAATFSRPVHTLHLNQLLKDVQKTYAPPGRSLLTGSMYGVRVGEEGPQDGLLFTLTRVTPTLKENVFPDFF
jgi:hypothetical protein